tara:strand:- start:31 stop:1581 length:1551 start_codon:yes stop_codon:yes gene_type:complete
MATLKGKSISSTYQNLLQTSSEVNNTTLKKVETGSGTPTSMRLATDKVEFTKVGIGTSDLNPDGLLHVMGVSAGSVSSDVSANQLTLENSTDSGLTILSGASSSGNIFFGDANSNKSGQIYYDHDGDYLGIATGGSERFRISNTGDLTISGNLSQSSERYILEEFFHKLPYRDINDTEQTSVDTTITSHTKNVRIVTQAINLGASDTHQITLTNYLIYPKSHVSAVLVDTSVDIDDNAMVNVMVHDVADGSCKIRIGTNAVDIDSMTFTIQVVVDPHIDSNDSWAITGVNSIDQYVTYPGTEPGIRILTTGSNNDQVILYPKISNLGTGSDGVNISAWRNVNFYSQYQTHFEASITTYSIIANSAILCGMRSGGTADDNALTIYTNDDDKAYFLYATSDSLGALTNNGNLHFVYSIGGVDYVTDLGIVVQASTVYRLKFAFDESRRISVFVNGVQYGLTSTPTTTTAGGVTQSNNKAKSLVMTSGSDIVPVIGVQSLASGVAALNINFVKVSRTIQ